MYERYYSCARINSLMHVNNQFFLWMLIRNANLFRRDNSESTEQRPTISGGAHATSIVRVHSPSKQVIFRRNCVCETKAMPKKKNVGTPRWQAFDVRAREGGAAHWKTAGYSSFSRRTIRFIAVWLTLEHFHQLSSNIN